MPVTPNIAERTVTGTFVSPDGTPAEGLIRFIPSVEVRDVTGHVIVQKAPIEVTLDGAGSFSVSLSVTDDPDGQPLDWTWHVTQLLATVREWDFLLPTSSPSTVDIATLGEAQFVPPVYEFAPVQLVTDLLAEQTEIRALAAVVEAAAVIHPYLIMGA